MAITIAFYGPRAVDYTLIADSLCDWLGYGQPDEEGYYAPPEEAEQVEIIVSGRDAHAGAVAEIIAWTARADLAYTTVIERAAGAVRAAQEGEEIQVSRDVESYIASALNLAADQDAGALVLMIEDGAEDAGVERLLSLVHEGVDVLVLSDALLPLERTAQGAAPVAGYPAAPVAHTGRQDAAAPVTPALVATVEQTTWPLGEVLDLLGEQAAWLRETATTVAGTLMGLAELAGRQGERIKQALAQEGGLGPAALPDEPRAAADELTRMDEELEAPTAAPEQAVLLPTPNKVKREFLDPADGTWKPLGRGRPRAGVEIREVPAA